MATTDDRPILVTGASGFLATHIIQQLQTVGHRVRGTVRSTKNESKVKPLQELCPQAKYPLELFEADLTSSEGWDEAVSGCQYVLHTASPFPAENPKTDDEVIKPAVDGTLTVLRACKGAAVKRVVLTSSVVAIMGESQSVPYTEDDWADVSKTESAYNKSKTLAEKAAWDYVASLDDGEKFELVVVNPSLLLGPVLCGGWATSMEFHKRLLERKMPALPQLNLPTVDVRDVAAAHIAGLTESDATGHRHILKGHNLWVKELAQILDDEFRPLGYSVPLRVAPYILVKIMSFFDKALKSILPSWGKVSELDNTRMKTVLKISPRPAKETVIDMAYSMIEKGFVKKTDKYTEVKGSGQ